MPFYSPLTAAQEQSLCAAMDALFPRQVAALQEQIRFESVKCPPADGLPFGRDMQRSLDHVLALCNSFGLCTRDLDGYVGIADYGQGAETLGILAHLDVVPAGTGWRFPPFSAQIHEGRLFGRGTTDDKGPALCALFALAAIIQAGIPLSRRVRMIFGCDEESGWACMDRYNQTEEAPTLAFSPDAEYPLVFSERAIVQATYRLQAENTRLSIHAGERSNVVPGTAVAILPGDISLEMPFPTGSVCDGFTVELTKQADALRIQVEGKNAHASTPESGKNALQYLLKLLNGLPLPAADAKIVKTLYDAFQLDMHGETLGLDTTDYSGRLTLNPGILHMEQGEATLTIDARLPAALAPSDLLARIAAVLSPAGFAQTATHLHPGHFMPEDSELVQKLLGVYRAQTGDTQSRPLAIGGGTYARAFPIAVGFGCEFPDTPMRAHMPDENISLEELKTNTRIMADAILALAR